MYLSLLISKIDDSLALLSSSGGNGDGTYPGEGGPDSSEEGPDPGEKGPDKDKPSKGKGKARAITPEDLSDDKLPGKGKGKARAITPEDFPETPEKPYTDFPEIPETPYTDLDEKGFQADVVEATLNSLKEPEEPKIGESSKPGENLELKSREEKYKQAVWDEYRYTRKELKTAIRLYNDILDNIERKGDYMDAKEKEYLLNESIKVKSKVGHYTDHAQNLKNALNIDSSEEFSSEQNSSEDSYSGDSSDEESRPSKRTRN
jgi:hypothetical protein